MYLNNATWVRYIYDFQKTNIFIHNRLILDKDPHIKFNYEPISPNVKQALCL